MKDVAVNQASLQQLPEELRQMLELQRAKRLSHIDGLSKIISQKRDAAVKARAASGIEKIWREDREYYLGIDDANRSTHPYTKSMTPDGGLSSDTEKVSGVTAFFNITRQFVDSASARMGDILLPAGDWNFKIKKTPVPELDKIKDSGQPVVGADGAEAKNPDGSAYTLGQFSKEELLEIDTKVEKGEMRIRDWLTECSYHSEVRKVIEDSSQIGTGILRGAYPVKKKARVVKDGKLIMDMKTIPSSKRVDAINFFPDYPACGDNIQNGSFAIERDYISARQLRDLIGIPGYIKENIERVLKEGPGQKYFDSEGNAKDVGMTQDDDRFEIWYFFGDMNLDDLNAFGVECEESRDAVPAIGVLINNTLIKGYLNPLDNGTFPYDVMCWQRMNDSPWGVGVSRQGRTAQDMMNAGGRALMTNMGLSAAPQIIIRQSGITPVDGEWVMSSGKFWYATEEADTRTVADAFTAINIPSMQNELKNIMDMALKLMEDSTGISFLLQGQQGSAPDTVGGMELLHKNSSALLRRIGRVFDESITEPHIRRYYDWLLIHGEDDEKGDMQIEAIGSSALVEREIQSMQAQQILTMSLNPVYEMSPIKAKDEVLRAWRFDPAKFDMDEAEKQAAAKIQQPVDPRIQATQLKIASDEKIATQRFKHEQETTVAKLDHEVELDKNDLDRDTAYNESIANRDRMTFESRREEMQLRERLATLEYANKHQMTLEAVKAKLTDTAMKLNVQKELSAQALAQDSSKHHKDIAVDLHKSNQALTPPTEPAGKALNGRAFQA